MSLRVFLGSVVHSRSLDHLEIIPNGFVAIKKDTGKIVATGSDYSSWKKGINDAVDEVVLSRSQFLMPGLVDCHIHAPQVPNTGLGLDKPLLEWLQSYTFPMEARYQDKVFAKRVYSKVVETTIRFGTTLAAYFATIHTESSVSLVKEILKQGQRAFVGKVSSDCNCPQYYVESLDEAIKEARTFVKSVLDLKSELVKPIVTPRFAVSCTEELMTALAKLAHEYDVNIQSHISENLSEIQMVRETFGKSYGQVYLDAGVLDKKCIMAHAVHLDDDELKIFAQTNTTVAHCPASNTNLGSGLCDVQRLLKAGIKVGLGTDVSGGHSPSILDAIVRCLDVSQHIALTKQKEDAKCYQPLNYKQAFYLSTLGGAEALHMDNVVGNFIIGKSFDALLIEISEFPIFSEGFEFGTETNEEYISKLVQKFIYSGDDRNILNVFVQGKKIK